MVVNQRGNTLTKSCTPSDVFTSELLVVFSYRNTVPALLFCKRRLKTIDHDSKAQVNVSIWRKIRGSIDLPWNNAGEILGNDNR